MNLRWEDTRVNQFLAQGNAVRVVNLQDRNGRPANGAASDEERTVPAKVAVPLVPARMEEPHDLTSSRINPLRFGPLKELQ